MLHGALPCSPDIEKAVTFVDERVMMALSAAKHASPGLSTRAWLAALSQAALQYGGTVSLPPAEVPDGYARSTEQSLGVPVPMCACISYCNDAVGTIAQGEAVNQTSFTAAYLEWSYSEADKRREIQQINDLQCAACSPRPHTLHVDANMKLYVWNRQRQAWREPYHSGVLFQDSNECQQHMQDIDNALGNERV